MLYHFMIHPRLVGQFSSASASLPTGTIGLLTHPTAAVQLTGPMPSDELLP